MVASTTQDLTLLELVALVSTNAKENDEEELKRREVLIINMAEKMAKVNDAQGLMKLLTTLRPHLLSYGIAKATKLIRTLIDICLKVEKDYDFKFNLCMECINWAKQQNRVFLRHMLEVRLMQLLNEMGRHTDVLAMSARLIGELKKTGNKDVQLEAHLEESKASLALNNLSRSRSALVSARSIAGTLCIEPKLQARLDIESGILNMAENRDYKTAFSYFYEAFENFDTALETSNAQKALKYMCLAKIILNQAAEVPALLSTKLASKYSGRDLNAIEAIAEAFQNRSLKQFYKAFEQFHVELQSDAIILRHIDSLTDAMLEKNIIRAIEPYSIIEIVTLAKSINFPAKRVEKKLAQMILDKKFQGVIDQQDGTLTVYNFPRDIQTKIFEASVEVIRHLSKTVDEIYNRANTL